MSHRDWKGYVKLQQRDKWINQWGLTSISVQVSEHELKIYYTLAHSAWIIQTWGCHSNEFFDKMFDRIYLLRNKMGIYAKWEAIGCILSEFPLSIRSIRCRSTWPLLMIFIMNFNSPKYGASRHPYWIMALLHFKLGSNNCTVVLGTVLKITFHLLITGSFGVVGTKVLSFEPSLDV